MTNISDEKEIIKSLIGQIRDLYVDIIKLRAEDRSKYKEMANRLDTLEKDVSAIVFEIKFEQFSVCRDPTAPKNTNVLEKIRNRKRRKTLVQREL